jgi:hypothetical protein
MSQFLQGTNALHTNFGSQLVEDGNTWDRMRQDFDYRRRGRLSVSDPVQWMGRWTSSSMLGGGENGEELGTYDRNQQYSRWAITGRGKRQFKVITGSVTDPDGEPVTGVGLNLFLANNTFVVSGVSDSNGNYELGTEYSGNSHFIAAYNPGSPGQAGATINNLVPTNRDGT